MRITICRKAHFNACHRVFNPSWSDEKNKEVFGVCSNQNYHGHNYELIVKLTGEVDPETGYVMDLGILKNIIKKEIEDRFDHKNLNLDTEEFKNMIPSTEHFARVIYDILRNHIPTDLEIKVVLYETPRNFVEYPV